MVTVKYIDTTVVVLLMLLQVKIGSRRQKYAYQFTQRQINNVAVCCINAERFALPSHAGKSVLCIDTWSYCSI